ncbi:hypothetical protein [Rhodoblastus sp.]|uniref:hypothetical protein n=1 Tax=Rhodoblastus sp. TaxID=1962975 RepID=UPI0026153AAB|nr:hypothetical protein [Rhodoblastus sp.]
MSRKLVRISLTAASRADLVGAWTRLGFALDADGAGVTLADGVVLAFAASDDPARRASVGLSAGSGETPAMPASAAAGCFQLVEAAPAAAPDHANGVVALREVVVVADEPADHAEFLSALTGQREMLATSAGLDIPLGGASLEILSPRAFAFRFGINPRAEKFHIAGLVFGVKNLTETEAVLAANGLMTIFQVGRLAAGEAEGMAVAFERA